MAVGFWIFLLISLASFHYDDWPSHNVFPYGPVQNLCGDVGAFLSYWSYYILEQGIYLLLFFSGVLLALHILHTRISDMWLRIIGLVLVSVAFAATVNQLWPGSPGRFAQGNGGILGIAAAAFLKSHMNTVGTYIVLLVSMLIGMVLCADEIVVMTPAVAGNVLAKVRRIAPAIPAPRFDRITEFFRQSPAAEDAPEQVADIAEPTEVVAAETAAEPVTVPLEGLARVLTEDEERALRGETNQSQQPAGKVFYPQRDPATPVVSTTTVPAAEVPPDTNVLLFTYPHDEAVEPTPVPAVSAHVDDDDPPPAVAVSIPEPEIETPLQPEPVRSELVVRMPGIIQPRRTAPTPPPTPKEIGEYNLPGWGILADAEHGYAQSQEIYVRAKAQVLEDSLREFGIDAKVVEINTGPVITMYEISMAPGTKVAQITALTNDIARSLAAINVRIVAPVPGKNTVGIEVPNPEKEKVRIKELMQLTSQEMQAKTLIPLFLGKDANGEPLVADLASMPHCLIAGTTGSGKSVCINSILMSIMYTQRPDHVKLVLFDPKVVEMAPFKDIPHLMCPVITEVGKAASVLEWACEKMDERYDLLAEAGVRNLAGYNKLTREELFERFSATTDEERAKVPKHMPYIVIVIDELADLMMTSGKEVESSIVRLAQKARAVGIHLILATQRPQATVVTGLIKANMPCKIAFRVASKMDSRIVLDQNGAELLLGQGDMLYLAPGAGKPTRAQGTFIDDREIKESVKLTAASAQAQYEPELVQLKSVTNADGEMEKDDMFDDAVRVVLESQRGSVSLLQRKLNIGYGRASRLIEMMAATGILGDYKGSQAREVMLTLDDWDNMKKQQQTDADSGMTV